MSWNELSGVWNGEIIDVFGGPCWRVTAHLGVGPDGSGQGWGELQPLLDSSIPTVRVKARARVEDGRLVLLMVAPELHDGVCWLHHLEYDRGRDRLEGSGANFEALEPYDLDDGEPGSLWLARG